MGLLIRNTLAVLPAGIGHATGHHDLYLEGGDIAGIDEAPEGFTPDEVIDGTRLLTIPGLVNAHAHTYLSVMRNAADDLAFNDWLFGTIVPLESHLAPEDCYWASLLSQAEMIRSGTTCFNDMQMHAGQTSRAVVESGMRAVVCRALASVSYGRDDQRIAEALRERDEFACCDRLSFLLGPHAPYSCGPDYLRMVADRAREEGMGIHIHLAESQGESVRIWAQHHCTPVEYVRDAGIFDVPTIAAHCTRVNASDRTILAEHGVNVATNPASNMKLGNGFAPVPELMEAGVNVCLGTDGAASNNAQNMFREMGLLALVHKGSHELPRCISADDALRIATRQGAKALGLPCGSIEVGKKADLALLDLDAPSLTPLGDPVAALAYAVNGSEVDTMIIDGKVVLRHRELTTIDEERVRFEVARICERLEMS
ncbi:MAG: amidohydrolase [Eggerthellaceae bacterium]|nr:amidohydrolase [Eggerthellaceae bacterium]